MNKFVESNKFDKVYNKIWNIFVWSNFTKIWHVLIHQIGCMKNIKSNFKSLQGRKNEENKNTNESTWSIFVRRFSFGVPSSLTFVIYFVISLFTSTNNSLKLSGVILNFIIFLLLETTFRKENIHLISNLIQKQLFSNRCFSKHRKIYLKNYLLKSFFNKASGLKTWNFIKKRPWYRYFHVSFLQVFKKPYLQNTSGRLLLIIPTFQPKFYPLITDLFFLHFFFFFVNCNYGILLGTKMSKMSNV